MSNEENHDGLHDVELFDGPFDGFVFPIDDRPVLRVQCGSFRGNPLVPTRSVEAIYERVSADRFHWRATVAMDPFGGALAGVPAERTLHERPSTSTL